MNYRDPSGGNLDDDDNAPKPSRKKKIEEIALYLAQSHGGDPKDYIADLEKEEPPKPKSYTDDDLLNAGFEQVTAYSYTDPGGKTLYQVVRYQHRTITSAKEFRQRRRHPENDRIWINGAGKIKVPYRWQDLIARPDEEVYFCEGEKDADRLASLGLLATTAAGQVWSEIIADSLRDRDVFILEDNDEKGRINSRRSVDALTERAKSIRVVRLPGLRHKQDVSDWLDAGHDKDELLKTCRETPTEGIITARSHDFPAEETIPMWNFLYGKHLLRGTVSGTAAPGGTGKSTMSIAEALAMTSGKPILGEPVPNQLRVILINLEDDRNTMDKRIVAAMKHHGLTKDDISDRLIVIARGDIKLKVAKQLRSGDVERNESVITALTNLMIQHRADVLSVDSFIRTHRVHENDNSAIEEVIECFEDIAQPANCAVHLWHHTRKGNGEGASVDSARGAKAFIDSCRSVRIFETMTKETAQKLRLDHPGFYFRAFSGKRNFAPPLDESDWFKFVSVQLNNSPLFGDDVGVVERW